MCKHYPCPRPVDARFLPVVTAKALRAPALIISGRGAGGANPTMAMPGFQ